MQNFCSLLSLEALIHKVAFASIAPKLHVYGESTNDFTVSTSAVCFAVRHFLKALTHKAVITSIAFKLHASVAHHGFSAQTSAVSFSVHTLQGRSLHFVLQCTLSEAKT